MLAGWAYGAIYGGSEERQRALPGWLAFYNRQRPHGSLGRQAPIERLLTLMKQCAWHLQLGGPAGRPASAHTLRSPAARRTSTARRSLSPSPREPRKELR